MLLLFVDPKPGARHMSLVPKISGGKAGETQKLTSNGHNASERSLRDLGDFH